MLVRSVFSGTFCPILCSLTLLLCSFVEESDQHNRGHLSRKGLTTTAINGVYKLMQDRRAQSFLSLHRQCMKVLKDDPDDVNTEPLGM